MDILESWTNDNDWIGFWGSYLGSITGAILGAGVAAWGIIKTINENRKLAVEPYLIFEEEFSCPENSKAYGIFLDISGNKYAENIIKITNVGRGPALHIKFDSGGKWDTEIPVLKEDESGYVAFESSAKIPEKDTLDEWSPEEIIEFCSQSEIRNVRVSCENIFGNISYYDLQIKKDCGINMRSEGIRKSCTVKTQLYSWKMK